MTSEKSKELLIKMYNKEVDALKKEILDQKSEEYQDKHHEIYTRYNIIWAALK